MTDASARIEELYASHAPMVLAVCRGLLRDRVEADDALQQTFLSAQRALANGSTPRTPESWLAAIARNECLARIRARAVRPLPVGDEVDAVAPDAHAAAVSREQVAGLRNALADLPAQQREAILLREVRGFSYDEVAASLSVTTSAVESLLFRARRRLQLTLREAVTALSPVGWLGPLRELAFRVGGGGGLGSNEVAKVVAVGVGAAALAGGVVVTPQLVRHGVAAPPPPTTTAPVHSAAAPPSASAQVLPPQPQPPVAGTGIWFTGALGQTTTAASEREPAESGDAGSESVEAGDGPSEPAESAASGGSEREAPASATAGASETESETPTTVATAPATGAGDTTTTPETRTTTSETATGGESGAGGVSSSDGGSDGSGDD